MLKAVIASHICRFAFLVIALGGLWASFGHPPGQSQALAQARAAPDLAMGTQAEPFQSAVEEFVAAAAAGDTAKTARMLSPTIAAKTVERASSAF